MIQQAMRRARATGNAGSRICRSSSVNARRGSAKPERRAGEALEAMTVEDGLSLREAVDWCRRRRHTTGGDPAAAPRRRSAGRRLMSMRRMSAASLAARPGC
jgi:hypothetical protein